MIKGSISQEDKIIINVYAFKNSLKTYYAKTDKTIKENRQIYYYNWRLQHPFFMNIPIHPVKNQ